MDLIIGKGKEKLKEATEYVDALPKTVEALGGELSLYEVKAKFRLNDDQEDEDLFIGWKTGFGWKVIMDPKGVIIIVTPTPVSVHENVKEV